MVKELKYLVYLLVIFFFIFFNLKYYFSNEYKKKSYRSYNSTKEKINTFANNLKLLKNNTNGFIYYVENNKDQNKKKYKFWELLNDNEK